MKKLNIFQKLFLSLISTMIISFLLIALLFYYSIEQYKYNALSQTETLILEKYKSELRSATEIAVSLVNAIYKLEKLSQKEKLELAKKLVRPLKFGNEGYYFCYEAGTGVNVIHGSKIELEGKNLWGLQEPDKSQYIIRELDKVAKNNTMFHNYHWSKLSSPSVDNVFPKLGTAAMIPGTNLWIGTGTYIDDINENRTLVIENIRKITNLIRLNFLGVLTIVSVLSIFFVVILSRNITIPIMRLRDFLIQSENIDFSQRIKMKNPRRNDEISNLYKVVNDLFNKLKQTEETKNQLEKELSRVITTIHNSIINKLEAIGNFIRYNIESESISKERLTHIDKLICHCSSESKNILFVLKNKECNIKRLCDELKLRAEMNFYLREISYNMQESIDDQLKNSELNIKPEIVQYILDVYNELLNNIVKHSSATHVDISVDYYNTKLSLAVSDNGIGFDRSLSKENEDSFGLTNLEKITKDLSAEFFITSELNKGTAAKIEVYI
jgi:signal transduction histidine kinase